MKSKSQRARDLRAQGMRYADIAREVDLSPQAVRKACKRKSRAEEDARRKGLPSWKRGQENTHNVIQPFQARDTTPKGYCMAWIVEDGRARRCGKLCKNQLCEEHAHTTRPLGSPLGRRDWL